MNIVINIVGYKFCKTFIQKFVELASSGLIDSFQIVDSALLPIGRNMGINATYKEVPDFTHILFIDDDMTNFGIGGLQKLIEADKPIVSGIFTSRRPPFTITSFDKEGDDLQKLLSSDHLIKVRGTGMAFTLVQRQVLDDTKEMVLGDKSEGLPLWFTCDRFARATFYDEVDHFLAEAKVSDKSTDQLLREAIVMGQTSHIGTTFVGEDIAFCERAKMFGHHTYIHTGVKIGHLIEEPVTVDNREFLCQAFPLKS